jgi:serine palmitoyltransferase
MPSKTPSESHALTNRKANNGQKPSQSLFSINNCQSVASQINDAVFVLRRIVLTSKTSESSLAFTKEYVLRPTFKNDLFVVSFGLPALSATPRVLDSAPTVRSDASDWTYQGTRTAVPQKNLLNVASYNYLGFVDLEYNTRKLLEHAVREMPLSNNKSGCNSKLEEAMKAELKNFMGFDGCVLTCTGYAINLVAFPAMAASTKVGGTTIFLMDEESHSSMFMGAFIACAGGNGRIIKFRHNNEHDLEEKLRQIYGNETPESSLNKVWVTVEGMYSMDGTLPPLPTIVALKRQYGFNIYIDEAHSFLAIGHTGRGVVEFFQEHNTSSTAKVSMEDVDMIGGTLSKSLSSVGGFVICHNPLTVYIESRIEIMQKSGGSSIPTLSLIRSLQILRKPSLVMRRLMNLRTVSDFVAARLSARGYQILLTQGGPLIAIVVDNIDRVLEFLRVGRVLGLICCGAAYPAAPRGAPRVRLSLTGAHTIEDAENILQLIDQISITVGVKGLKISNNWISAEKRMEEQISSNSPSLEGNDSATASDSIDASILDLCPPSVPFQESSSLSIRSAGVTALSRYNLGAAGPRWMYGTFAAHLSLEDRLNNTINSMLPSKFAVPLKTTLFTEARVGIMSIIATAMEGLTLRRAKKGERHLVLLPDAAGLEILEGAAAAQRSTTVITRYYTLEDGENSLREIISTESSFFPNKLHITLYLDISLVVNHTAINTYLEPLSAVLKASDQRPLSLTLLINDPFTLKTSFSTTHTLLSHLASLFPAISQTPISSSSKSLPKSSSIIFQSARSTFKRTERSPRGSASQTPIRFLLFTSFHHFGVSGAFATGSQHLIEKVQFLGQGVMYTAMMPPVVAAILEESLIRMATVKPTIEDENYNEKRERANVTETYVS